MRSLILTATLAIALTGCKSSPLTASPADSSAEMRRETEAIRLDMEKIPPPSKTRYLAVKELTAWDNPYLTVQGNMVTLHVTVADANTSGIGNGNMLRPVGARRQDLNVRTSDLGAALNAVPSTAWPYGRVVAVEEAHDAPASALPELRRNTEATLKTLGDIGIVAYEWQAAK